MHPVLFDLHLGRLGSFTVGTYGLFYALGFLLALRLAVFYARREGIETARIVDLGIVALLAGFVGAKVVLYLLTPRVYLADPMEMIRSLRSAGVFYGGFLFASLAAVLYVRRHRLPLGRVADLMAPPLALGQAVGRLGCFAAGCCYGKPASVPWAVTFTDVYAARTTGTPLDTPLHPSQLYESALAFLLFLGLLWLSDRKRFPGQVVLSYTVGYSVIRFVLEYWRGDLDRGSFFGGALSTSQLIAIVLVLGAAALWPRLSRKGAPPPAAA